jgi:Uma2 family endonuclease
MATVTPATGTPAAAQAPDRLLTASDLAHFPSDLPSGSVRYELDNGRLVVTAPPGYLHGVSDSNIHFELKLQGERRGLGQALTEVGLVLRRNPDRVVGPDAVFITIPSLPVRLSSEGYLETMPDLVVEVRSPSQTTPDVEDKVNEYLQAGVRVVWVADPARQTVTAYRNGQPPQVFAAADTLTVEDVIPGFQAPVGRLFTV